MRLTTTLFAAAATLALAPLAARAQTPFGTGCAGASGVTPELSLSGTIQSGQSFTLEVTAPGGLGFGYLFIGPSNTSASFMGGVPLPLDLRALFSDPRWAGCNLLVDPLVLQQYTFDPTQGGGTATFLFPGFDSGRYFVQALNVDPDFTTNLAGLSNGLELVGAADLVPGMVPIAAGTFEMGSSAPSGAPYFPGGDEAVHTVTIGQPFWMGQHEVTQAEYSALMGSNPSEFPGPNRPVELVSWLDAVAYCQALTAQELAAGNLPAGYEYRLPTEAEWEYACRAGTTTEFAVGNGVDLFCTDGWISFSQHSDSSCNHPNGTTDVGSFAPNAWGLFDMHGNVYEWCFDTYATYPAGPVTNPLATGGSLRVFRGGSWFSYSSFCRSAERDFASPGVASNLFGFRVVLGPVLGP